MVREAIFDDLPELIELGEAFHAQMIYNDYPYDPVVFGNTCAGYIEHENFSLWIGKRAMAAAAMGTHIATGHLMCSEIFLYSEAANQGLRLLRSMEKWAHDQGANQLILTDQMNMRDLSKLYKRVNAKPIERVYMAEVN